MNQRIAHDAAVACSQAILECIENCLREEEKRDAFHEVYQRVKAACEAALILQQREQARRHPSSN